MVMEFEGSDVTGNERRPGCVEDGGC